MQPTQIPVVAAETALKIDWGLWQVLIGVAALALYVLTILLAVASVWLYIWGKPWIVEMVHKAVKSEMDYRENELRGRLVGYVGFIFGRLREVKPDFIHAAIDYSGRAYERLADTSDWKITALNNLAFYLSVRGYSTDSDAAIKYAKALLDGYALRKNIDWLTTYASVVVSYYKDFDSPRQTLLHAEKLMEELQRRDDVTPRDKQNAARHLEGIRAAIKELGP